MIVIEDTFRDSESSDTLVLGQIPEFYACGNAQARNHCCVCYSCGRLYA